MSLSQREKSVDICSQVNQVKYASNGRTLASHKYHVLEQLTLKELIKARQSIGSSKTWQKALEIATGKN